MAKLTIAEAKAAAAAAADEAVTLGEQIREKIKDENLLELAETAENLAIEKAGEAEEKSLASDVNSAAEEAMAAVEKLNNILNGEIVASATNDSDAEQSEEIKSGETEQQETPKDTSNDNKNLQDSETDSQTEEKTEQPEEIKSYVYIGPSVKRFGIRENAIFRGTKTDVLRYLSEAIDEIPHIAKMIFETAEIAEKKKKAKEKGNSVFNAYEAIKKA